MVSHLPACRKMGYFSPSDRRTLYLRRRRQPPHPQQSPLEQTETSHYNNHNQLTSTGNTTYSYNDNGHTRQKSHNGETTDYHYNREERLIRVSQNNSTRGEYAYNPYGQRIKKTASGSTTWYLYNDEGLVAEYDGQGCPSAAGAGSTGAADSCGQLIKEYHFKPGSPWMTEPLFQRTADNQLYYYQNDHLGTPQTLLAKTGAVVWAAHYSAFGGFYPISTDGLKTM